MTQNVIDQVNLGFTHEDMGSQQVFRQALEALSRPAQWLPLLHDAAVPIGICRSSAGMMLALLDANCALWLSEKLKKHEICAWLRFHTGCQITDEIKHAQFAWLACNDTWPHLNTFNWGTDIEPQNACTILIDVDLNEIGTPVKAEGPGLIAPVTILLPKLGEDFPTERRQAFESFPCGPDIFLCADEAVMGLPRTTSLNFS
jgi:alpha-D-ribose 1-methylphosphonate 5-triphosphate synthase subunit PhnH